jgi:transposase
MKANITKIQKRRQFSKDFKRKLVSEFESGKYSVAELGRLHKIQFQVIYNWIYKFSNFQEQGYRVVEMTESSNNKVKDLELKIRELERVVGQKQLTIDYLNTMMEVAKDELDIDIKKNFGTPRSDDSKKIKGK